MIGRTNVCGSGSAPVVSYSIYGWCQTAGLSYAMLSDITEADMRTLMTKYASVAYFMQWYLSNPSMIDQFIANTYAMKWIGLRDYICDKLLAFPSVKAAMLASDNWEYILKDHVPIMTGYTAPYGNASASSEYSSYYAWKAFDGISSESDGWYAVSATAYLQYQFTNPICVQKVEIKNRYTAQAILTFKVQGSNDGTNFVDLGTFTNSNTTGLANTSYIIDNSNYYMYYRLQSLTASGSEVSLIKLQFHGRSLNVSVPKMTSDTAPYGTAFGTGPSDSDSGFYKAFDGNDSTFWSHNLGVNGQIGYHFTNPVCVKRMKVVIPYDLVLRAKDYSLKASNDGTNYVELVSGTFPNSSATVTYNIDIPNNNQYLYYRLDTANSYAPNNERWIRYFAVQFFGVDYSERTDRTYLYDHGLYMNGVTSFQNVTITQPSPYASSDVAEIHNNPQSVSLSYSTSNANFVVTSTKLNNKVQFGNDNWLFVASENTSLGRPEYHIGNTPEIQGSRVSAKTVNNLVEGLNISQISGQYYIYFNIYGRNDVGRINIDITEIWLE